MAGRARAGEDARGTIGEIKPTVELIDENKAVKSVRKPAGRLKDKLFGLGLLVIVIGLVMWFWPIFDFWVLSFVGALSTGPKIVAYGILIIVSGIIADALVPIIVNLLLD